ncbi:MAG: SdpI family protein [Candidatus Aenigmatarchaeota archaeon]|nr:SdpI family protein [Candidatus Aenigmarchaeota archaeon]
MKKFEFLASLIIIFTFLITIYFYTYIPDIIESHWDLNGNVNGYMKKASGLLLIPIIMIFSTMMFFTLPKIDPLKENIKKFRNYYYWFIIIFCLFMLIIQLHLILWNVGFKINPKIIISFCCSALFFYVGILLGKTKRNWFIGIRTPWTLSSDYVWEKTNKLGGMIFKMLSILCLISILFEEYYILFVPIIISAIFLVIYSYFVYKKSK